MWENFPSSQGFALLINQCPVTTSDQSQVLDEWVCKMIHPSPGQPSPSEICWHHSDLRRHRPETKLSRWSIRDWDKQWINIFTLTRYMHTRTQTAAVKTVHVRSFCMRYSVCPGIWCHFLACAFSTHYPCMYSILPVCACTHTHINSMCVCVYIR